MTQTILKIRHTLLLTLTLILAACSSVPNQQTIRMDDFPRGDAEEVFAAGFGNIIDKYINEVSSEDMVIEGLKGLSSLDTVISIDRIEDKIVLKRSGTPVSIFSAPEPDDSDGWAYVAAQLTAESRKYSSELMNASEEELYEIIFDGALGSLDFYSRYAGNSEADNNRAKRDGFGGIGVIFKFNDNKVLISKVLADTPAETAGIHKNDELILIEYKSVDDLSISDIVKALRGPVGSSIHVRIINAVTGVHDLIIKRQHIIPETVTSRLYDQVLQIKINSFNHGTANSLDRQLQAAFAQNNQGSQKIKGIILDLRGNPGGLLKQSIKIADTFLTHGNILDTQGRHADSLQHYEASGEDKAGGLPIVVLVDGRSASASEIVAAALQDRDRAVILGTVSYGKGTVQTVIRLPNNGELILTWSRFMTPSGYALHGLGVYPVICTSGITGPPSLALLESLEQQSQNLDTINRWRQVGIDNKSERKALRSNCPPETHTGNNDLSLARLLIEDSVLYNRALELTPATAEVIE